MGLTGVLFLMGFATGCLLAFARHPIYGLATYVAVFYLHPPSRWWGQEMPDLRWSLTAAAVTLLALWLSKERGDSTPSFHQKVMPWLVVFVLWVGIQSFWALDSKTHMGLLILFAKYALLVGLIYKCVDSEKHLRLFLWTHVLGCAYLGWLVFTTYLGGRFEGFGGPNIDEANSGALQIVTGIFVASSLFLAGRFRDRAILFGCLPFIVNALVATMSRSGFLAAGVGGLMFNFFTPSRFRLRVGMLSVLAAVLFLLLTNPVYWTRIGSLKYAGEEVEGVDTGIGRLVILQAQWRMFRDHPFGCGHRCTAVLSPQFLDDRYLSGEGENRARSSHNTPMTMLVEHGIPGAVLYVMLVVWTWRSVRALTRRRSDDQGFIPTLIPAVAAILAAITIGDLFVDYLKLEVRLWFVAILMVLLRMTAADRKLSATNRDGAPEIRGRPAIGNAKGA